ncbi:endoglucanase [Ferrigenium kumadai]|uniref:cellulase n=1 Tax=Ferrigenium kumadai TaxID=1682490 RepID=A0AAN1SYX2_9PROT|nr:cellulose synthase complex periplasmic endoglucanase BcsZ [Ferrigenium kumadai]BBI99548.1 endoglucanase [Ferrigenium kumadai]
MRNCFAALILLIVPLLAQAGPRCAAPWPLWQEFAKTHIQADGRVMDHGAGDISTSEGQAYALFFALVAHDRQRFDRILKWTSDNLARGDLRRNLPGWKWGKDEDGAWHVLDPNPASDADLWLAYSLYHAAAVWKQHSYRETASALLKNIAAQEVAVLPNLGSMLLPAPYGFTVDSKSWRLNPSYLPVQLLRYFSTVDKQGAWNEIRRNTLLMIAATSNRGTVPDWVLYDAQKGFQFDAERGKYSSYEAIRIYLWWAMLNQQDELFEALRPYVTGTPHLALEMLPERVDVSDGTASGQAPIGFTAALAPYRFVLYHQRNRTPTSLGDGAGYYNYVLSLFGYGWLDRRYRFNPDGSLGAASNRCSR